MGLFDKILRNMPGSPKSIAKLQYGIYNRYKSKYPDWPQNRIFHNMLIDRYSIMKTVKESEFDYISNNCDNLIEFVLLLVVRENPPAMLPPYREDTIGDILKWFLNNAPEEYHKFIDSHPTPNDDTSTVEEHDFPLPDMSGVSVCDVPRASERLTEQELAYFVINLWNHKNVRDYVLSMNLSKLESNRFLFCLLNFNIVSVIWWINFTPRMSGPIIEESTKNLIDNFTDCITDAIEQIEGSVKISDYILDEEELTYLGKKYQVEPHVETSYSSLFKFVFNDRIPLYYEAFDQKFKAAFDAKRRNPGSLDPVTKLFLQHFKGNWQTDIAGLFLPVSLFLHQYHEYIGEYIRERTKRSSV